jgi:hypothetical protein
VRTILTRRNEHMNQNQQQGPRNQQQNRQKQKRPITREEVTLLLHDAPRSFKPIIDGRMFIPAVQVSRRTDIRALVFDYTPGYASVAVEDIDCDAPLERELVQFVPRMSIGHDDAVAFVKLLNRGQTETALAIANAQKVAEGLLTHRIQVPEIRRGG